MQQKVAVKQRTMAYTATPVEPQGKHLASSRFSTRDYWALINLLLSVLKI